MTEGSKITVDVECDPGDAISALERLAIAADKAREAIERLGEVRHGGIHIVIAGSLANVTISPSAALASGDDGPELVGLPKGAQIIP